MNALTKDTPLSEEDMDALRDEARELVRLHHPSTAAAARDAGVAESTFAAWLNGSYTGDRQKVGQQVRKWVLVARERGRVRGIIPTAPGYQPTPTSLQITSILQFAQALPDLAVITTSPGCGKTAACEYYASQTPNTWLITAAPDTRGVNRMLIEICTAMGLQERSSSRLTQAIGSRLRGTKGLIIIDEAQFLSIEALEMLRVLHNGQKVGVALVGNRSIHATLHGGGREDRAQLFSRIGMRLKHQVKPQADDISMILDAWAISAKDQRDYLTRVASRVGALRVMTKVLTAAAMMAAGRDETLALPHLQAAWGMLDAAQGEG